MAVVGLTTGAYAWLMGPALHFLLTGGTQGLDTLARLWPSLSTLDRAQALWVLPVITLVIGAVKGAAYLGQFYTVGLFGQRVVIDLRRRVFVRLMGLSPGQLSQRLSGDLLGRFTSDVASVELAATYTLASYFRDILQILILVAVAFSLAWKLALVLLVAVPLAAWPAGRLTRALLARLREGQAALGALSAQVHEGVGALRTLQVFDARDAELQRFDRKASLLRRALERAGWTRAATPGVMELLAAISIAAVLALAVGARFAGPEQLVSFIAAVVLAYQPAKDLGRLSGFGLQAAAALERIDALLELVPQVRDVPGAVVLPPLRERLTLSGVRFDWAPGRAALRDVSLEVRAGQTVAVVGPSGSGKSTLLAMLLRFEAPQAGRIELDGVDVAGATTESVRAQFALVTQEPLLFSASVRDNLKVARPGATDAELAQAVRAAGAHELISRLPQGLETVLGERGVTLSGGERQRLCLARALLSGAPVLLLDEATRSLDAASERQVQAAIDAVLREGGRTAIVVAHRLSTVRDAAQIFVLEEGRVVEQGDHLELMRRGGRYAALVQSSAEPALAR
ncbi:MAG: ABC transporter ATP-binding protein [Archangiaceae bacterium]|nr:ABC transporter ATP-binding protein [Archangiaceae bacterium]